MKFPFFEIIKASANKFELASAMIKYSNRIEEQPELLAEYTEKDKVKKIRLIMSDILNGKIKYHFNDKEKKA